MAVIRNVPIQTSPRHHGCISTAQDSERPYARNSSGLALFSSGTYIRQQKEIPILRRDCIGTDLELFSSRAYRGQHNVIPILKIGCNGGGSHHVEFEHSGRISGRNCKRRAGRTSSAAYLLSGFCSTGNVQVSAVEEEVGVMEGDVVEYPLDGGAGVVQEEDKDDGRRIGVGVIVGFIKDSDVVLCEIEPLCQEDPGSKEWLHDESEPEITVPIGQVRVLQAWYSQRMVPDRISNPHGEHAENLWLLE